MADWWEEKYGLNTGKDDATSDKDGDGLSNIQEYSIGSDPTKTDTDGDGQSDLVEFLGKSNPTKSSSTATSLTYDINGNGRIDVIDIMQVVIHKDTKLGDGKYSLISDVDSDGDVDMDDINAVVGSWNAKIK